MRLICCRGENRRSISEYNKKQKRVHFDRVDNSDCDNRYIVNSICSYIQEKLKKHEYNSILFIATGALMSPTSAQQGESIPSIAHLVHIKNN